MWNIQLSRKAALRLARSPWSLLTVAGPAPRRLEDQPAMFKPCSSPLRCLLLLTSAALSLGFVGQVIRHVGPMTPFGGLGEPGAQGCTADLRPSLVVLSCSAWCEMCRLESWVLEALLEGLSRESDLNWSCQRHAQLVSGPGTIKDLVAGSRSLLHRNLCLALLTGTFSPKLAIRLLN